MGSWAKEGRDPSGMEAERPDWWEGKRRKPRTRGSQAETVANSVHMIARPAMLFITAWLVSFFSKYSNLRS